MSEEEETKQRPKRPRVATIDEMMRMLQEVKAEEASRDTDATARVQAELDRTKAELSETKAELDQTRAEVDELKRKAAKASKAASVAILSAVTSSMGRDARSLITEDMYAKICAHYNVPLPTPEERNAGQIMTGLAAFMPRPPPTAIIPEDPSCTHRRIWWDKRAAEIAREKKEKDVARDRLRGYVNGYKICQDPDNELLFREERPGQSDTPAVAVPPSFLNDPEVVRDTTFVPKKTAAGYEEGSLFDMLESGAATPDDLVRHCDSRQFILYVLRWRQPATLLALAEYHTKILKIEDAAKRALRLEQTKRNFQRRLTKLVEEEKLVKVEYRRDLRENVYTFIGPTPTPWEGTRYKARKASTPLPKPVPVTASASASASVSTPSRPVPQAPPAPSVPLAHNGHDEAR